MFELWFVDLMLITLDYQTVNLQTLKMLEGIGEIERKKRLS